MISAQNVQTPLGTCMCGIVGCLALAIDADPDQAWVASATQRIAHRGPDDEGFYSDHDVALGYKRLAIIDLSQGGHQPMRSADGRYWMVFNGEIYNYVELGAELREQGVVLRSSCDSEVLLETYARVGKDVVHRLRGMFAFAIWDSWTRELFCARDQFGIKPFYYRVDPGPPPARMSLSRGPAPAGRPVPGPGDGVPPFGPDDWFIPRRRPAGGGGAAGRNGDATQARRVPRPPSAVAGRGPGQPGHPGPVPQRAGDGAGQAGPQRLLRFASERKALADPGELRQPRPRRAAPVPVLPVRPAAGHPDPAGAGAAARPRHDRPARRGAGRLPLLAGRPAARPRPQRRPRRAPSWT